MSTEFPFQITTILFFVTAVSISGYYRQRAAKAGDKTSWREEGAPIMILLRLFGFSMWLGLIAYMINPAWMAWSALPLPAGLRWAGAGLAAAAVPLLFWMFRSLGQNITDTVAIRKEHRLVTHGPYRWIRHPLYSFGFLLAAGFILLTANGFIGLTGLLAGVVLALRTPIEETKLIETFGDEYRDYMRRTGRFLPRLTR
jgi:protein-S-isoprenylcysteine O-methyltransferase Ste14